jgi:SNF2 family DNA or RNA helicase
LKLVVEAEQQSNVDDVKVDAGFLVKANSGDDVSLKKLKPGNRLYFYIDDVGDISHTCGVFKQDPIGNEVTNQLVFRDAASLSVSLEPKRSLLGTDDQQDMHRESMRLKGSRIAPSYMEIKKIKLDEADVGGGRSLPYAFVTGKVHRARDPRLTFLSPQEKTQFGSGQFDVNDIKALGNGNFLHLTISPYADQIENTVQQQIEAFQHYSTLYSSPDAEPEDKELWVSKYEHTRKLLKPHANEIYKYHDGVVYYVNTGGNWQTETVNGIRKLDIDDRLKFYHHLDTEGLLDQDLTESKYQLALKSLLDQRKLATIAPALQQHVKDTLKEDLDDYDRRQKKLETLRPTDGPLGTNDLPGLKKGVELFPHQSMILASLKDRNRMLVDADPGAGKALVIICDILQQIKARKVKRPLVLMPESLLPQFAREVKEFSELNPWIISTDSIKRWGKRGDISEMLEDAKKAPRNTVFLTSYNWISLDPELVANGEISEDAGKIQYKTSKQFSRTDLLLKQLKIDVVFMDEAHILRGASNMARAAAGLARVPMVRGLTGTIMPGNPYDITGPMSLIHGSVFGTKDDFTKEYTVSGSVHNYQPDAPKKIRNKLKKFGVVSVRKSAWAHLLPKIHREFHYADFTPDQKKGYAALLANILDEIRQDPKLSLLLKKVEDTLEEGDEITAGPLLARFTPLDVFLNAPSEAKDWLKSLMLGNSAISPKSKTINSIIHSHLAMPDAGKVLVFVQYKESAKNLFEHLSPDLKSEAAYYEGGMVEVLNRFKDPQDPLKILFGVDKTLVTGHNIQAANCIINADLKWLAGDMSQREARAARIGQKRDVYIHNVLVNGSAEVLKMAKLITAEHLISKANSDFTDNKVLQPVQMTLENMQHFTKDHQLHPYIARKKDIDASVAAQSVKEKDLYGPSMMKPHGYTEISNILKEAKILKKVPSAKDFSGDDKNYDDLVAQDLEDLPTDPKHPKLLSLDLFQWDGSWDLFSYKSADPDGFLRRFGFSLMRGYYYLEVTSKAAVDNVLKRVEKQLTITNKPEFEKQVRDARVVSSGIKGGLRKASQKARGLVAAEVDEDKAKKGEISLEFSIVDGAPVVWTQNVLSAGDAELAVLKRIGFELEPAFWKKPITRSQIKLFLSKLTEQYPQVRIANWKDFKELSHLAFKGLDLTEFDSLLEKI